MPMPSSGKITTQTFRDFFEITASTPINSSDWYRGGPYVRANYQSQNQGTKSINNQVPTSGRIALSDLYGVYKVVDANNLVPGNPGNADTHFNITPNDTNPNPADLNPPNNPTPGNPNYNPPNPATPGNLNTSNSGSDGQPPPWGNGDPYYNPSTNDSDPNPSGSNPSTPGNPGNPYDGSAGPPGEGDPNPGNPDAPALLAGNPTDPTPNNPVPTDFTDLSPNPSYWADHERLV